MPMWWAYAVSAARTRSATDGMSTCPEVVHLEEWPDTEGVNLTAPKFGLGTAVIQMSRVSVAAVIPLLCDGSLEAAADFDERPGQAPYEGQRVRIPRAVDDG
jgi:hypothetical protein